MDFAIAPLIVLLFIVITLPASFSVFSTEKTCDTPTFKKSNVKEQNNA
jgi:hypothetical protein